LDLLENDPFTPQNWSQILRLIVSFCLHIGGVAAKPPLIISKLSFAERKYAGLLK
jgi:hypothetical protein